MYALYEHDLARLIESEVLGETTFATAARSALTERRRRAWKTLERLESQTRLRAEAFLRRSDLDVPRLPIVETRGLLGGVALAVLPWRIQMALLLQATREFLPGFERLARAHRNGANEALFRYIVEHELALAEFARREASGEGSTLSAVERLLATAL